MRSDHRFRTSRSTAAQRWAALAAAVTVLLSACGGGAAPSAAPASSPPGNAAKPAASSAASASAKPAASTAASAKPAGSASAKPAASAGASAKPAAGGQKLTVSYSAIIGTVIPLWVADQAGIFQKNGLNVELTFIESSKGIPALVSGQTQFADIGGSETMSAVAGGADLVTLTVNSPVEPFILQVPASIKTPQDLKGKKLGVSNFGSASDIALREALDRVGLDPDKDVSILAVGSSATRIAAMESGAIQGGMSFPPESLRLEQQGFHTLMDLASLKVPSVVSTDIVSRSFLQNNRATVQKFVDSMIEANARARKDKPMVIDILKKQFKSDDTHAMEVTYDFFMNSVIPPLPYPKAELYESSKRILGAKNEAVKNFDAARMIDDSFVKSAADRGLDKG
jgi:NitT/TauT family transport system substrate-binding protein